MLHLREIQMGGGLYLQHADHNVCHAIDRVFKGEFVYFVDSKNGQSLVINARGVCGWGGFIFKR